MGGGAVVFNATLQFREQFKMCGDGLFIAYRALTGVGPAGRITWDDIERLLEDKYRELNHLKARRES